METVEEKKQEKVKKRKRDFFGIYKANKNKNGAAAQFKMSRDQTCLFLELAKQTADMKSSAPYDWKNQRILVKLGPPDIGKMLALLHGTLPLPAKGGDPDLKLYHQTDKGNKVITMRRQPLGYYLEVSASENNIKIRMPVTVDEGELLAIVLRKAYELILGW